MDIVGVKVLSGFLFFFDAFFFGCIPFFVLRHCLTQRTKNIGHSQLIQCLHALASGVLIATCLLHLLPESLQNVQNALLTHRGVAGQLKAQTKNISRERQSQDGETQQDSDDNLYPVAELFVALGFLVIFMIDSTIRTAQSHRNVNPTVKYSRLRTFEDNDDETEIYVQRVRNSAKNGVSQERKTHSKDNHNHSAHIGNVSKSDTDSDSNWYNQKEKSNSNHLKDSPDNGQPKDSGHVRSAALVLALCIHGFFDGVMLGLQTSKSVLFSLMMALLLHKSFVAISLSLTLVKNHSSGTSQFRVIAYILLFAFVAPLGLATSAAFFHSSLFASEGGGDVSIAPGCIQAFAVGTFLYVTFTETTGHHGEQRAIKYEILSHFCLLLGFSFMALIRMAVNDT